MWLNTHKIQLIDAENTTNYEETAKIKGKLIYILTDFASKDPHSAQFVGYNGEILHLEPPQMFNGKFGPGVIIT